MNKSIAYYSRRYAIIYAIMLVVIIAITFVLYTFLPDIAESLLNGGGGTGISIASIIVPPMVIAHLFFKHEERQPKRSEGWLLALIFTILAFVLSGVAVWIGLIFQPLSAGEANDIRALLTQERTLLLSIAAIFAVMVLLFNKVVLWSGVRGEIKKSEKLAIKAARKG